MIKKKKNLSEIFFEIMSEIDDFFFEIMSEIDDTAP